MARAALSHYDLPTAPMPEIFDLLFREAAGRFFRIGTLLVPDDALLPSDIGTSYRNVPMKAFPAYLVRLWRDSGCAKAGQFPVIAIGMHRTHIYAPEPIVAGNCQ